jgi:hypothetical protein
MEKIMFFGLAIVFGIMMSNNQRPAAVSGQRNTQSVTSSDAYVGYNNTIEKIRVGRDYCEIVHRPE